VVPFEFCEGARPSHSEETDDEGGSGCTVLLSETDNDTHRCAVPILPETDDDGGLNEVVEVFSEGGGIFICVESLSLWMAGDKDDTDGRCGDEVRMIE
jgi:hypothetical protein